MAEAGFQIEDYRAGTRSDDSESVKSGKYFAGVRGHADDPESAVEAVEAALGGEPSAFSNFRAERMIAIGPGGALRRDRRDDRGSAVAAKGRSGSQLSDPPGGAELADSQARPKGTQ